MTGRTAAPPPVQARPKVIGRMLFHRDPDYRHAMRWYTRIGRRVWFHEVFEFLFSVRPRRIGPTLRQFMGETLVDREYALAKSRTRLRKADSTVASLTN